MTAQVVRSFDYDIDENSTRSTGAGRNLIAQYRPYFNVDFKDDKAIPTLPLPRSRYLPSN